MPQYLAQITNPRLSVNIANLSPYGFINRVIASLIIIALVLGVIIFLFMLITGGIQWVTSAGNKVALENARNKITHALIGLVILFSIWALIQLINLFFGIDIGNIRVPRPQPTRAPYTKSCEFDENLGSCGCKCPAGWVEIEGCSSPISNCSADSCTCEFTGELPTATPTTPITPITPIPTWPPIPSGNCGDAGDSCSCRCPAGQIVDESYSCDVHGYPACIDRYCLCYEGAAYSYVRTVSIIDGVVDWLPCDFVDNCAVGFETSGYPLDTLQFGDGTYCDNLQGRSAYTLPPINGIFSGEYNMQITCDGRSYSAAIPLGTDGLPDWDSVRPCPTCRIHAYLWQGGANIYGVGIPDCDGSSPFQARGAVFIEGAEMLYTFYTCGGQTNVHAFPRSPSGTPDWNNPQAWEFEEGLSFSSVPHCNSSSSVQAMSVHVIESLSQDQLRIDITCDGTTRTALFDLYASGYPNWGSLFWYGSYDTEGKIFPDRRVCREVLGRDDTVFTRAGDGLFQQALTCLTPL